MQPPLFTSLVVSYAGVDAARAGYAEIRDHIGRLTGEDGYDAALINTGPQRSPNALEGFMGRQGPLEGIEVVATTVPERDPVTMRGACLGIFVGLVVTPEIAPAVVGDRLGPFVEKIVGQARLHDIRLPAFVARDVFQLVLESAAIVVVVSSSSPIYELGKQIAFTSERSDSFPFDPPLNVGLHDEIRKING